MSAQPFQESFKTYKDWVTWSWMVSIWEKCDMFDVVIDLNDSLVKMPRSGDEWIMQMFVGAGFNKDELQRLNRVRVHQQVLFLSCVLGASGKLLNKKYMTMRKTGDRWSKLKFPKEKPKKQTLIFGKWR